MGPRKNNFTFSHCRWPQMWGRLQPARDFSPAGETRIERCSRRAKAPPQAEACPTWTGGPTLARKCAVIPAPALSLSLIIFYRHFPEPGGRRIVPCRSADTIISRLVTAGACGGVDVAGILARNEQV